MPRLTIAAATVNSPHWTELFVQSVRMFTKHEQRELVIIDNGSLDIHLEWLRAQPDVTLIENEENVGHGAAMDMATGYAAAHGSRYLAFFDIDSHVQREGWETDLITLYNETPRCRLVGVVGPEHKPLHPPLFFFEPRFILDNGLSWRYQPDHPRSTDTAQKVYWDIKDLGYEVVRLEKGPKIYAEHIGDEIVIGGVSSLYHAWYGSRYQESGLNPKQELDDRPLADYLDQKRAVFAEPLVKEILAYNA